MRIYYITVIKGGVRLNRRANASLIENPNVTTPYKLHIRLEMLSSIAHSFLEACNSGTKVHMILGILGSSLIPETS